MITVSANPAIPRLILSLRFSTNPHATSPSAPSPARIYPPREFHVELSTELSVTEITACVVLISSTHTAETAFIHDALRRRISANSSGPASATHHPMKGVVDECGF